MTFSIRLFSPPLKNNYLLFSFLQFDYNYCILWIGYCNWENFEKSELSHLQFVDSNFLLLSAIYRIIFHSEIRESNFKIAQKNAKIILNAGKARTRFDQSNASITFLSCWSLSLSSWLSCCHDFSKLSFFSFVN